jgi:hypothetical protein
MCRVRVQDDPERSGRFVRSESGEMYRTNEGHAQIRRSSGGGLRISLAELPNISCVLGEYVPRVARARFTLRTNSSERRSSSRTRRQQLLTAATSSQSTG